MWYFGLASDEGGKFTSPMSIVSLSKHLENSTDFDYLSIVGSLLHICGVSRPNCSYSASCLASPLDVNKEDLAKLCVWTSILQVLEDGVQQGMWCS